ncbi:protein prenylyltransferase [Neoconidiobolus thromboides FSU 785]|nr:protein prenylyltransferase [Neoconidiobolus thromboides FSU 785]
MSYGLHGQKKVTYTDAELTAIKKSEEKKIHSYQLELDNYELIKQQLFPISCNKELEPSTVEKFLLLNSQLLLKNPDYYTLWNDRRSIPKNLVNSMEELKLTQDCFQLRPKTYWIWNHRSYILDTLNTYKNYFKELQLINFMLNKDARNFHGWNYRLRIVAKLLHLMKEKKDKVELLLEEWKFTGEKIKASFSNASAWHYRIQLKKKVEDIAIKEGEVNEEDKNKIKEIMKMDNELKLVKNAFYTDPEDQSSFIYYFNLMDELSEENKKVKLNVYLVLNQNQWFIYLRCNFNMKFESIPMVFINHEKLQLTTENWVKYNNNIIVKEYSNYWKLPLLNIKDINQFNKISIQIAFKDITFENKNLVNNQYQNIDYELQLNNIKNQHQFNQFIIKHIDYSENNKLSVKLIPIVENELNQLIELIELEPEARWPLNSYLLLYQHYQQLCKINNQKIQLSINNYLNQLLNIDKLRKNYYLYQKELLLKE